MAPLLGDFHSLGGSDMLGNQWPSHSIVDEMWDFLAAHHAMALVHSETGHIYGGFGLRYDRHFTCWFYYYLFPLARKQGFGKVLLAYVEASAFHEKACLTIGARCASGNLPSIKALHQAGFASMQSSVCHGSELLFIKTRCSTVPD